MYLSNYEKGFLGKLRLYGYLILIVTIFSFLGIAIAVYALSVGIPAVKLIFFLVMPVTFLLLAAVFFKIKNIIELVQLSGGQESQLSTSNKKWAIKAPVFFQPLSIAIVIIALIATAISAYGLFFRQVSSFGRLSTFFIVLSLLGCTLIGWILYMVSRILSKYVNKQ